jgi:hypothetical protein
MFVDDVDDLSCSSTEVPQLERRSLSRSVEEVARDRKLTSKMPIQWRWPGHKGRKQLRFSDLGNRKGTNDGKSGLGSK